MNAITTKRGAKDWHPFKDISDRKIVLEEGEDFELCFEFVRDICTKPCEDRTSGQKRSRECNCLSILEDNAARQAAVARYMVAFQGKPHQERHSIVMAWLRYTTTRTTTTSNTCFFIPFLADNDDDEENENQTTDTEGGDDDEGSNNKPLQELKNWMVCKDAISLLLDYGRIRWRTCVNAVLNNKLPAHGNKGKVLGPAKRFQEEVKDDLHAFFEEIKQFGMPTATRAVREATGTGLRDGEEGTIELPTSWSKRAVFARFCYERGYIITSNARGNIQKTERSDAEWRIENKKTICSWWKFLKFWESHYANVRLASPSADICTDCHIFFNRSKYTTRASAADRPTTRTNNSNEYVDPPTTTVLENETEELDLPPQNLQLETQHATAEREAILSKATMHVKQALIQRQLANQKVQQAIDSVDLPHQDRHYCFIADFSQNMELPFFGESQPGDTYYFSALKINVFGIVDCSIFGGKLSVHVYHEGVGKKGGNNVCSMLVNEFKRLDILKENQTAKELTIIMDNCAGQNKNRMVLRLATYLVEAEYFEKVSFVFYIVGHTKNACDRWFNTLKRTYRRSNIYSFDQLTDSMKTHKNINVTVVNETDFKDWDKFWDSIYKRLAGSTTHKTHIFSANKENKTLLRLKDDNLPETQETTQDLMKKGTNLPTRPALLKSPILESVVPPGIPPIKQVELFSKYRALIPESFRDVTCPDPGEDIKKKIRSERNTKARERKKSKIEIKNDEQEDEDKPFQTKEGVC